MAFTGAGVFQTVSDGLVQVTGLSLAAAANGTISLAGGGGDEELPADFQPGAYADVDLAEAIEVYIAKTATSVAALDLIIAKTAAPFLITITNDDGVNVTPNLEIRIRFH